ncbi:hypothetical protein bcgnr5416_11660 [Bacillus cereus]|nr:hypothetical protein BCJMU07_1617 [Bacillus cereus]BCC75969.1 hypothetical protein BCJMU62_1660 [Bacillus cereus]BCD04636.1 hypothetical protein BC30052_1691 [Bacillus cereus]
MYREELKQISNEKLEKELIKSTENEANFMERKSGIDKIDYKEIKKKIWMKRISKDSMKNIIKIGQ